MCLLPCDWLYPLEIDFNEILECLLRLQIRLHFAQLSPSQQKIFSWVHDSLTDPVQMSQRLREMLSDVWRHKFKTTFKQCAAYDNGGRVGDLLPADYSYYIHYAHPTDNVHQPWMCAPDAEAAFLHYQLQV